MEQVETFAIVRISPRMPHILFRISPRMHHIHRSICSDSITYLSGSHRARITFFSSHPFLPPFLCHLFFVTSFLPPLFCHPFFATSFLPPLFCHPVFATSFLLPVFSGKVFLETATATKFFWEVAKKRWQKRGDKKEVVQR